MRKLLIILTLFGLMLALLAFEQTETSAPFQPKVLAALGFILLSAYTLGEGVRRLGLPQLLGYILSGVLFGPHLSALIFGDHTQALFNSAVVEELALINLMAQGLIGLAAGGELKTSELREGARSISWVLLLQTVLGFGAVGGAVYLVGRVAPDAMAFLTTHASLLAATLLFGTLAVGTSPAATLAVLTETKAKGPLSSLTLGIIVSKDVTTVTLYLLALSLAQPLASGQAVEWATLQQIGVELGGALLLGPFLGGVIIAYLKWIRAELMLFTVVLVFVGQWLAQLLHAEVLLSFIVAGFFVENFSAQGEKMIQELKRLSQPVFVVFFTIAAAKLKLGALREFWLVVLVYALARGLALYWATRWGTQLAQSPPLIRRWLPWNFIAQSGVTLTLAGLTRGKVPWADEFQTIIMATISVHVVLGPTILKLVLQRAGEVPPDPDAAPAAPDAAPARLPSGPSEALDGGPSELAAPAFGALELDGPLERLRLRLEGLEAESRAALLLPRQEAERALLRQAAEVAQEALQEAQERIEGLGEEESAERLRAALQRARQEWLDEVFDVVRRASESSGLDPLERGIETFLAQLEEVRREAPESVVVPQEPARFMVLGSERPAVRWLKRAKRLLRPLGLARTRVVPLRVVLRFSLVLPVVGALSEPLQQLGALRLHTWGLLGELWLRTDARLGELQRALEADGEGRARALELLRDEREALAQRAQEAQAAQDERLAQVERGLQRGLSRVWEGFLEATALAGTWEALGATSAPRFEEHQRQKQALGLALRAGEQRALGAAGALWLELEVKRVEQRLQEVSQRAQGHIERALLSRVCAHTLALRAQVEASRQRLARALVAGAAPPALLRALVRERDELLSALHDDALAELQRLRDERLSSAPLEEVLAELRLAIEASSAAIKLASPEPASADPHGHAHAEPAGVREVRCARCWCRP